MRSASRVRALVDARRARRLLRARYDGLARALGLDPDWRVHRVVATSGDVTVALVGGEAPAAVLKYASSPQGSAALEHADAVVTQLAADPRLAGWTGLVPRGLGSTVGPEGHRVTVEQLLPGIDGRTALASDAGPAAVQAALDAVEELHRRTAVEVIVDERLLRAWVDEPIAALAAWHPIDADGQEDLAPVREFLRQGLEGRSVCTGWTHGDLSPRNLLFDRDGRGWRGWWTGSGRPRRRSPTSTWCTCCSPSGCSGRTGSWVRS